MHEQKRKGAFRIASALILASASPRRRSLLASLGIDFRVEPSSVDEPPPSSEVMPREYALSNARLKALDVAGRIGDAVVLGADTIVVLHGRILGKPADDEDARRMLALLSGQVHHVITGCHVVFPDAAGMDIVAESRVRMASFGQDVIDAYVSTGECLDKAGSYAIQGLGAFMIERIEGSYTNIVGLPLEEIVRLLYHRKVLVPA